MKSPFLAIAFVALMCGHACCADERPNILLIVADDLGFSDLGCYGGEIDTPVLDSLAARGVRLTHMYSTGRCCPSRASLLTGQYPHAVGLGHMTIDLGRPGYRGIVAEDADTLGDVFKRAGYSTWISGKWHLGSSDPTQHGYDEFFGTLVSCKDFWSPERFYRISNGQPAKWDAAGFFATDAVTDFALEFLREARKQPEKPWFGYLAYHAPHFPLHAPPDDIQKYADRYHVGWDKIRDQRLARMKQLGMMSDDVQLPPRSRYADWGEADSGEVPAWESLPEARRNDLARRMAIYAAMVDRLDQQIGRLIDNLRGADEFDHTLIVFLSDNGACAEWDPFGFDGVSGPDNVLHEGDALQTMGQPGTFHSVGSGWSMASNTPFRRFKHYCHEGGVRGPCIVHWPGKRLGSLAGSIEDTPAHLIDVLPTLAGLAAAKDFGSRTPAGADLRELFVEPSTEDRKSGEASLANRPLFFEHEGNRAVVSGDYKLVSVRGQPWELYKVRGELADPTEQNDLANEPSQKDRRDDLAAQWAVWAESANVTPLPVDYGVEYLPDSGRAGKERMQDNAQPAAVPLE